MIKRSTDEWRKLKTEWEMSGIPQTEWCKKKSINLYTFRDRLSRIRKEHAETVIVPKIQWTEAVQAEQPVAKEERESITVIAGKLKIVIPQHCISAVLKAASELC